RAVKPLREGVQGRGEGETRRRREVAHPPSRPLLYTTSISRHELTIKQVALEQAKAPAPLFSAAKLIAALSSLEEKAKACQLPTFSATLNEGKGYMQHPSLGKMVLRALGPKEDEAVAKKFAAMANHVFPPTPRPAYGRASDVEKRSNPAEELAPAPQIVVDQLKEIMNNAKTVLDTTIGRIGERFDSFVSHPVVNAARVFDMSNWPDYDDDDDTEDFGAVQIGAIYHHYKQVLDAKGFSFQDALMEWTELHILVNRRYPRRNKAFSALWPSVIKTQQESAFTKQESARFANIFMITGLLLAFPVNSAKCEMAFSLMNTVKTDWRNKLTSISLTSLMKINLLDGGVIFFGERRELCRRGTILPRKEFATERFFASNRAERVARDIWGFPRLKDGKSQQVPPRLSTRVCSRSHPGCQRGSAAGPIQAVNEGQAAGPTQAVNEGQAAGPTQAVNEGQAAGPTQAVNEGLQQVPPRLSTRVCSRSHPGCQRGSAAGPTQAVNEGQTAGPTQAVNEGQAAGPTQAVNEGLQQVPPRLSTRVRQQVPPMLPTRKGTGFPRKDIRRVAGEREAESWKEGDLPKARNPTTMEMMEQKCSTWYRRKNLSKDCLKYINGGEEGALVAAFGRLGHVEATHPLAPLVHMIVDLWLRLEHLPVERLDLHKETHVEDNTVAGCETHFDGPFGQRWTAVTIGHKPHGLTDCKMDLIHTDNGSLHSTVIREYLINCTACNETHVRMGMAQHMDICGEVLIECRGCGNTAKRSELDQFEAGLSTLWQTGKLSTTQKTTLDRYTAKQARTAADPQRNKKQLIDKLCLRDRSGEDQQAVQKHESTCCHRLEDCLCGMKIKRGSRDQHSSTICPSQPIPCPLGCQSQVKRGTAVLHSSQACPRLVRLCRMPGCNFQGGQEVNTEHLAEAAAEYVTEVGYRPLYPYPQGVSAVDIEPLSEEPIMDMGRTWVREDLLNTTGEEKVLEARAIQRLMDIGKNKGYTRLSPRVKIIFQQYRYEVSNFHRRNRVYRAISGLLTYGLRRGPPGTYYNYNEDLLDVVRDTYPSGDDVNWMLTNQDNRTTKEVGVEDLFDGGGLVEMFYRRSHQHKWKYNKNRMFRTDQQGKLVRPTGRPKLLLPVFEKREVNVGNLLDQKLPKWQWAKLKALPLLGAIRDATCHDMPYYCMASPPSPYTSTTDHMEPQTPTL
ncbi:hypothetical protein Bbelb_048820, partial [Branchiostoma belcheri]